MAGMRKIVVDLRDEDEALLERAAWREHRSMREHAAYLLHQKIHETERPAESLADDDPVAQAV